MDPSVQELFGLVTTLFVGVMYLASRWPGPPGPQEPPLLLT